MQPFQPLADARCSACGAAVPIPPGAKSVHCTYCGNVQVVNPSIPIAHQVDQIGQAVANVDRYAQRVAAELAIPRLTAERNHLAHQIQSLMAQNATAAYHNQLIIGFAIGISGLFLSTVVSTKVHPLLGGLLLLIAVASTIGGVVFYRNNVRRTGGKYAPHLAAAHQQLQRVELQLSDAYRRVSS